MTETAAPVAMGRGQHSSTPSGWCCARAAAGSIPNLPGLFPFTLLTASRP
jgi:hypothetical protein